MTKVALAKSRFFQFQGLRELHMSEINKSKLQSQTLQQPTAKHHCGMARAYDLTAISLVAMTFCLMGAVMKKKRVFWFITSFVDVKDTSENNEGNNLLKLSQEAFYIISNKKLH